MAWRTYRKFWDENFQRLDALLDEMKDEGENNRARRARKGKLNEEHWNFDSNNPHRP